MSLPQRRRQLAVYSRCVEPQPQRLGCRLLTVWWYHEAVGIDWCAAALQVSLNEGGHQLRLYHGVPDASVPFSEACQPGRRVVPGASLLVRLVKTHAAHTPAVSLSFYCSMKPEAQFAKYLTTILRLSYDSAKVTINLRWTSNLRNILQRAQGFS